MKRKLIRYVNGYRSIYFPDHPRSYKSGTWKGWIYEHTVIAEQSIGRYLRDDEVVHHLDFDRSNNRSSNLLVLPKSQHTKLHRWLDSGAPGWQHSGANWVNSEKPKSSEPNSCHKCGKHLQHKQKRFCSKECYRLSLRKVERPSQSELASDLSFMSWEAIARKYGVSSNAIRKWAKAYKLDKATLSQAGSTLPEGAETSGEVKPS
jgi:hypothetical protein